MGFRDPLRTAEGVDTGPSATGPGARLYQGTVGGFPAGVLEMRDGVTGDAHATLTSSAFLTPQYDGGGQLIGYTSAGRETLLDAGSTNGTAGPKLSLSVLAAALGGYEAVAELLNAARFTTQRLRLTATGDASPTSTDHAAQIGPDGGANLIFDGNEIMARNNGAASVLTLTSPITSTETFDLATAPSNALVTKSYVHGLTDSGTASVSAVANTTVSQVVNFGQTFAAAPSIQLTAATTTPDQVRVGFGSVTTTGFTLYVFRTTTAATGVRWTATLTD